MRKLLFLSSWILATSLTLFTSANFYHALSQTRGLNELVSHQTINFTNSDSAIMAYAAIPSSVSQLKSAVLGADARPISIENYFQTYNSPLKGTGKFIVDTADTYRLDPYLIIAIAQQESNLCKIIPDDSYNCWGWGIHKQGTLRFANYQEAITAVSKGLKENYFDKGYDTPEKIMSKYTPLSDGSWANGVHQFLKELESGNY